MTALLDYIHSFLYRIRSIASSSSFPSPSTSPSDLLLPLQCSLRASLQVLVLFIVGYLLGYYPYRDPYVSDKFIHKLSGLTIDIFLPSLILYSITKTLTISYLYTLWPLLLWSIFQCLIAYLISRVVFYVFVSIPVHKNRLLCYWGNRKNSAAEGQLQSERSHNHFKTIISNNDDSATPLLYGRSSEDDRQGSDSEYVHSMKTANVITLKSTEEGSQLESNTILCKMLPIILTFQNTSSFPLTIIESFCEQTVDSANCFNEGSMYLFIYSVPWNLILWIWGYSQIAELRDDLEKRTADGPGACCNRGEANTTVPYLHSKGTAATSTEYLICSESTNVFTSTSPSFFRQSDTEVPFLMDKQTNGAESGLSGNNCSGSSRSSFLSVQTSNTYNKSDSVSGANCYAQYESTDKKVESSLSYAKIRKCISNSIISIMVSIFLITITPSFVNNRLYNKDSFFSIFSKVLYLLGLPTVPLMTMILAASLAHMNKQQNQVEGRTEMESVQRTDRGEKPSSRLVILSIVIKLLILPAVALCLMLLVLTLSNMYAANPLTLSGDRAPLLHSLSSFVKSLLSMLLPPLPLLRFVILIEFSVPTSQTIVIICSRLGLVRQSRQLAYIYMYMYIIAIITSTFFCFVGAVLFFK